MPQVTTELGEVLVYDGDNAAELATACDVRPVPEPDDDGAITLVVPTALGGSEEMTLTPGDGLVKRPPFGFLLMPAAQVETFRVDDAEAKA